MSFTEWRKVLVFDWVKTNAQLCNVERRFWAVTPRSVRFVTSPTSLTTRSMPRPSTGFLEQIPY